MEEMKTKKLGENIGVDLKGVQKFEVSRSVVCDCFRFQIFDFYESFFINKNTQQNKSIISFLIRVFRFSESFYKDQNSKVTDGLN